MIGYTPGLVAVVPVPVNVSVPEENALLVASLQTNEV